MLENIATAIGAEISKVHPSFAGRIQMAVKVDDMFVKVSQTAGANGRKINTECIKQEKAGKHGNYELCFFASATNVKKEKIAAIVDDAVSVFLEAKKLTFEKQIQKNDAEALFVSMIRMPKRNQQSNSTTNFNELQ